MIYKHKFKQRISIYSFIGERKLLIGVDSLVKFLCRFKICDFGNKTMCQ